MDTSEQERERSMARAVLESIDATTPGGLPARRWPAWLELLAWSATAGTAAGVLLVIGEAMR